MTHLPPFHNTYRSTGSADAPDLVLLHGWGLHSIVWDDVMPGLLEHFRVTVVDLPGMGQSPLPNDPYTLDFLVGQVASVMPEKAHLMGWSLGGLVALRMASLMPERVRSVVSVATSPKFTRSDDWPAAMPGEILAKFAEIFDEDQEGTLIRFLALNCKGAVTQKDDIRKLRSILYFCGLPAGRALREGLNILRDTDLRDSLVEIARPTLMLFGEHDNLVPAAVMAEIEAIAPNVELALQQGVSHVPFVSAPDIFLQAVTDFYRSHQLV